MLVTIVAVPNADNTGIDKDRVEKVEDVPDEVARRMVDLGTAREPSDDELAAYHKAQDGDTSQDDSAGDTPPPAVKTSKKATPAQPADAAA